MTEIPVGQRLTDTSASPTPRVVRGIETWETVVTSFQDRLEQAGFAVEDIPAPESEEFPKFLADVQESDPVLAAELSRTLRRFRDQGNLPSTHAASSRERKRRVKQSAIMRQEGQLFVFDKRKAPLYGLAGLFFVFGPVMYFLSRPPATAPEAQKKVASQEGTATAATGTETSTSASNTAKGGGSEVIPQPGTQTNSSAIPTASTTATISNRGVPTTSNSTPANNNLDAFKREQAPAPQVTAAKSTPTQAAPTSSIAPPMVTPPPVTTSAPRSTPASNVYRPVPVTPSTSPSFGNTIPNESARYTPPVDNSPPQTFPVTSTPRETASRPVAVTPVTLAPASNNDEAFGSAISTPAPARATASSVSPQTSSPSVSSAVRPVAAPARATAPATRAASPSVSAPAATVPAPSVMTTTTPATSQRQEAPFGAGINQPAPSGVGVVSPSIPTAANSEPDRPVTSGLIYQRKRPEAPQNQGNMTLASTTTTNAAPANQAPAAGEGVTFGALGNAAPTGVDAAQATTAPAETPFGGTATNQASKIGALGPYKNLQQVPVRLVTAVYALTSGSVPVVVVTPDGGSFVGVGTINGQLARVDMAFRRYIDPQGQVFEVDALAYTVEGQNLTQGVPAKIEPVAPTLALDAAQNGASALQSALTTALSNTGNAPKIAIGDGASISSNALPPLWQILAGGVGQTFSLPKATQSISRIAKVDSNTQMVLILGIGASQ